MPDSSEGRAPPRAEPPSLQQPEPLGRLLRDRVVRGLAVLLALSTLPLIVPFLDEAGRATYGRQFIHAPFLIVLIVALGVRIRRAQDAPEHRFWMLLGAAFLFWLSAVVMDVVAVANAEPLVTVRLVNGLPYLLFYGAMAAALEIHPHVSADPLTGRLRTLDRVSSLVFLFALLMYFLVLPGLMADEFFWASTLALFAALDGYIVIRLFGLREAARDAEWRATYSWLLAGAAIWGVGDVSMMLMDRGIMADPGYGTLFDVIWPVAFVVVAVATRAGAYQPQSRPIEHHVPEPPGMGPALVYAAAFPFLHLLLYHFASFDPGVRPAREVLVLASVATLAMLALAYHRLQRIENRRLIRAEEEARQKLAHLAFHDELTGLPNREMFQDHLRLAMADAKRYERRCAVLFCDLDRFKVINDSLGHEAGDQVLISTAQRLISCVRALDTVARFGGDEFTIILQGIKAPLDSARIAQKMLETISAPLMVQGKTHVLTTSLGIAIYPDDGADESTLLKHADTAMYQAKLQGRNTYRLFTEAMNEAAEERLAIEQGLRTGSMDENFVLLYQPIVRIATGEPMGYEALLRWNHPERGLVAPGSFIDVAEQTGLIVPIGQWVLETACTWATKVGTNAPEPPSIAVNISGRQLLEATFVEDVMAIVERTGLAPSRLQLEITEPLALDTESAEPVLTDLRAQGISIAVDDFGTGFAALSRLRDFPVDVVKIDRSFVTGIEANSVGETIVRAIVTMSKALDFRVVAEGVETERELAVLTELQCQAAQGFYLQAPALPEEIERRWPGVR